MAHWKFQKQCLFRLPHISFLALEQNNFQNSPKLWRLTCYLVASWDPGASQTGRMAEGVGGQELWAWPWAGVPGGGGHDGVCSKFIPVGWMERTRMTMAERRSTVVRWDRRPLSGDCSWSKPAAVQPGMASGARGKISYKMVRFLTQLSIANISETITNFFIQS